MSFDAGVYQCTPTQTYGQIDIQRICGVDGNPSFSANSGFCSLPTAKPSLMALDRDSNTLQAYWFDPQAGSLSPAGATTLDDPLDSISGMTVGGVAYLFGYHAASGYFRFFALDANLEAQLVFQYHKTYGDVTTGFTTVHPYAYKDLMLVLAYNQQTGDAGIYQVQVPATSPLSLTRSWKAPWAKGWHHFGFFSMGGENFFIKSNQDQHDTVYIDHLVDDPSQGSHPVGRNIGKMNPASLATLELDGIPYFATLDASGGLAINRFHVDLQGWSPAASTTLPAGATQLVRLATAQGCYFFVA